MADNKFNVKVVEKSGRTVKSVLQKSDVCPSLNCWDDDCPICDTRGSGSCCVEGVVYRVWCVNCERKGLDASMFGETGRTAKVRCSEHRRDYRKKKPSSNLWEHVTDLHQDETEDVEFGYEVLSQHPGNPLTRQLEEAYKISNYVGNSLNDKDEWVRPAHIRIRGEKM